MKVVCKCKRLVELSSVVLNFDACVNDAQKGNVVRRQRQVDDTIEAEGTVERDAVKCLGQQISTLQGGGNVYDGSVVSL